MIHHQLGQAHAVDQHDAFDGLGKLERLSGVAQRGDEDAFLGTLARQGAVERLNLGADRPLPAQRPARARRPPPRGPRGRARPPAGRRESAAAAR